jgi:hypothetical protein
MSIIKEVKAGKHDRLMDLLSKGANVREVDPSNNRNLLHLCVDYENHSALEELLKPEYALSSETQVKDRFGEVFSLDSNFACH